MRDNPTLREFVYMLGYFNAHFKRYPPCERFKEGAYIIIPNEDDSQDDDKAEWLKLNEKAYRRAGLC